MTKTVLKDAAALKSLLTMYRARIPNDVNWLVTAKGLLDQAFTEEEEPRWEPKEGQEYYFIDSSGDIERSTRLGIVESFDQRRINYNNCFPTREAAEKRKAEWLEFIRSKN